MTDYAYLSDVYSTVRFPKKGKPLAHNTRLFAKSVTVDGKEYDAYAVRFHATDIVTVLPDGRALLANNGWDTVTTLQRIREYGTGRIGSFGGQWKVQLQPDPNDPRPAVFRRSIPKPFFVGNPGPEPVKTHTGWKIGNNEHYTPFPCIAGTTTVEEYEEENYVWDWKPIASGAYVVKIENHLMQRNWGIEHITWGEHGWYGGGDKQCPHCRAFMHVHDRWSDLYHGSYWPRVTTGPQGYKQYCEMMKRFGTLNAWNDAYLQDFHKRKEYLRAEREWFDRNWIDFYDGIIIDVNGYAERPDPEWQAKMDRYRKRNFKMKERISKFVNLCMNRLEQGIPMPSGSDCWYCLMMTEDGTTMGDMGGDTRRAPENDRHLIEHMKDGYVVPSLLVNALREKGYKDTAIFMFLGMDPDNNIMKGGWQTYDLSQVRRALRSYLEKRLMPKPPVKK